MKKLLLVVIAVFTVFTLAACGGQKPVTPPSSPASGQTPASSQSPSNGQTQSNTIDTSSFISEERAREIALEHAGLSANDVVFERTELDFDDGVWQYEVEFNHGKTEYDADIKASDGTILEWAVDID